ncbi:MAG: polysaccharide biosynthesis/export family protein [Bacteroides sp.]|nr:polysaccharide biosynthesis/export family protein [Bacteroides sp.]
MKHHLFLLSLFLLLLLLSSCNTSKKILYFQDVVVNHPEVIEATKDITVQPMDQISIMVSSKDPQLAALFNLTRIQVRAGSDLQGSNNNGEVSGYTLDDSGNIDFPVLGTLHIAGMTKNEIAALVKKRLIEENLVKDPVVTVEFMNLNFSVLGEVTNPGKYSISKDQITLLEALSMAGDLTIYGQRDGIYVIREENGQRTTYLTDIRSKDFFRSPVYYLKQNDVVYVQPNKVRAGQSTINDNNVKSVSLWLSIGSFLTTLAILIFN